MRHHSRKRFGQNFLQSEQIINKILNVLHLCQDDKVVEIGPGLGALTLPLLKSLKNLTAIEIDRDLQEHLSLLPAVKGKLNLIAADALTIDYSQWGSKLRIIGNLPYNISTPLLFHLLNYASYIEDMHFMLQKEVVARLAGCPGSKVYGRLTVMVQYRCKVEFLFDVPPEAFHPMPKVNSAMVRLIPYKEPPFPVVDVDLLRRVVAKSFAMRRKTIANNLKPLLTATQLDALKIDPLVRPEQLSVLEYVKIAKLIAN